MSESDTALPNVPPLHEQRKSDHRFGFATRALHAGTPPDPTTGARAFPIHLSSSFIFESTEEAAELFSLRSYGNIYSRISNPTVAAFEERLASLEGGLGAVATASGLAAQLCVILTLASAGDDIVASSSLYGGTVTQLKVTVDQMGITPRFVPIGDLEAIASAIGPRTRLLYVETIGNPSGVIADIGALAELAHEHGIPLVVDNTFATPYLCRPLEHGADIVVHSATKFISGHGTVIAGAIVESGRFPWRSGRHPLLSEPSRGYHGLPFAETFGEYAFLMRARAEVMRGVGASLSPMSAWLLLQGLETLPLRMARHVENARTIARYLQGHPAVAWVAHPEFADTRSKALAARYLPLGVGAVFTFGLHGGVTAGRAFIEALELWSHLANVGDAKSLVIHPASTTHRQLTDEELRAAGITPETVRLSVGLEDPEDLIWDLEQALTAAMSLTV